MLRAFGRLPPAAIWVRQALAGVSSQACGCAFTIASNFSSEPEPRSAEPVASENVRRLADEITSLTVLECSQLTDILRKKLNMQRPAMGMMPMMGAAMPQQAAAPAAAEDKKPKEEPKKEQTEFSVKLESFSADGKIKVIKEVRAITGLGLKEAKELVEKAPVVIKPNLSKADADAMKKALEDVGGKVALE